MEAIRIEDIVPQGAEFYLRKTEKTYRLNPITLADEIWMQQTFGDSIADIFSQIKMKEISRIVYRLMTEEDKEDFAARTVIIMNEEGEKLEKRMGGAELLFVQISGYGEKIKIFEALLQTLGISRPVLEKMKGNLEESEKKTPQPTGRSSSTSSPTSTAGRQNTSSVAPPRKSQHASKPLNKGKGKN
jgi:hypothetical protein